MPRTPIGANFQYGQAGQIAKGDALAVAVEEILAACGGDARAAIRALLIEAAQREEEKGLLTDAISRGYVRGRIEGRRVSAGAFGPDSHECGRERPSCAMPSHSEKLATS